MFETLLMTGTLPAGGTLNHLSTWLARTTACL
jgi:hypothetical protein